MLYVMTVLIWGTTWFAIEFQLGVVAPAVSVFYRYALASLLLFAWCRYRGLGLQFGLGDHARFALLGSLLFCANYILTYYAQQHITSALSAIAFSTMLWMNILNARIFFGMKSGWRVLFGSLLGIIGIAVLFYPQIDSLSWSDATVYGTTLCLSGAFLASLGNMVSQSAQNKGLPIVQSNAWGMMYGAILTGVIAYGQGVPFNFDGSLSYVLSLAYLVVFGSIFAFGAYLTLLGRIGAHKAGYALVMFPVVALVLSILFEDLPFDANIVVGILLVIAGNVFILRRNSGQRRNSPDQRAPQAHKGVDQHDLAV
jgi:drug/metabolite transporter (DMT)-like permease